MTSHKFTNLGGLNLYQNPLETDMGHLIHAVNVDSVPYGAKTKRAGVSQFQGTADGQTVKNLFAWYYSDTAFNLYRYSGSILHYSPNAGSAWTPAQAGTFPSTAGTLGHAVLGDALILGDGIGSTRHTTSSSSGGSFTNTTLAPVGAYFTEYHNRIYIGGTSSDLFWSSANDATNWAVSGTSDSSSLLIGGERSINGVFNNDDRAVISKKSGIMKRWDESQIVDLSTRLAPTSPSSLVQVETAHFFLNPTGIFMYDGVSPRLISNAIQSQLYNNAGSGVAPAKFLTAAGGAYKNDYLLSIGTVTDTIAQRTIANAVVKYNFQHNEFLNYSYPFEPTAFGTYQNTGGTAIMMLGASGGYTYSSVGTETTDAGTAISAFLEYVVHWNTLQEKTWRQILLQFNPGCQAQISVAVSDSFQDREKRYVPLGDVSSGKIEYRFPQGSESTYLFIKVTESSKSARFTWYGFEIDADIVTRR